MKTNNAKDKKPTPALTVIAVSKMKTPGYYRDGQSRHGLHLQVSKAGTKSWVMRFTIAGRVREMGLGSAAEGEVSLVDARAAAAKARALIRDGIDPIEERDKRRRESAAAQANTITFTKAAEKYVATHAAAWKHPAHARQWENSVAQYCGPVIGTKPVNEIELVDIMRVLEPHWLTKTVSMARLRGRIEKVLYWAKTSGYRSGDNPARWKGHLDTLLASPRKVAKVKHFAALDYREMPAFWEKLRKLEGSGPAALAFAILTAARSGEARGATWSEVDLDNATWTIPAERMKGGIEHRVPLSKQAIELLRTLPQDKKLVFPSPRGGQMGDTALTSVLRRMEVPVTAHGFRSSFSTWVGEATATPTEIREACLAHISADKVAGAYQRSDFMAKRAAVMQLWADHVTTPAAPAASKVTPIRRKRA